MPVMSGTIMFTS